MNTLYVSNTDDTVRLVDLEGNLGQSTSAPHQSSQGGDSPPVDIAEERLAKARQLFYDWLLDGQGKECGLTYDKVTSRIHNIKEDDGRPGMFIISVVRHRACAGAVYHKGSPMSACETYTQEMLFDPEKGTLSDHEEVHVSYAVNVWSLASEMIDDGDWNPVISSNPEWGGKRRIEVSASRFRLETDSYEVAREKLAEHFRELNYESQFEGLDVDDDLKNGYISDMIDAVVELVIDRLEMRWKDPELVDAD